MKAKSVLEVAELIPELDKEYEGDILEILEDELWKRGLGLEEFIVEMSKMLIEARNDVDGG